MHTFALILLFQSPGLPTAVGQVDGFETLKACQLAADLVGRMSDDKKAMRWVCAPKYVAEKKP